MLLSSSHQHHHQTPIYLIGYCILLSIMIHVVHGANLACSSLSTTSFSVANGRSVATGETVSVGVFPDNLMVVSQDSTNNNGLPLLANTNPQPTNGGLTSTSTTRIDMISSTPKAFPGALPIITRLGGNTLAMGYITSGSSVQTRFSFDGKYWMDGRMPLDAGIFTDLFAMAGDNSGLCLVYRTVSSPFNIGGTCSAGIIVGGKTPGEWVAVNMADVTQQTSVSKAKLEIIPVDGSSGTFLAFSEFTSGGVDIILIPGGGTKASLQASIGFPAIARRTWAVSSSEGSVTSGPIIIWASLNVDGLLTSTKSTDVGKTWSSLITIEQGAVSDTLSLIYTNNKWVVLYSSINDNIPAVKSRIYNITTDVGNSTLGWSTSEVVHGGSAQASDFQRSLRAMNMKAGSEGFGAAWVQVTTGTPSSPDNTYKIQSVFCPFVNNNATLPPSSTSALTSGSSSPVIVSGSVMNVIVGGGVIVVGMMGL
jgi:hypothetical protein